MVPLWLLLQLAGMCFVIILNDLWYHCNHSCGIMLSLWLLFVIHGIVNCTLFCNAQYLCGHHCNSYIMVIVFATQGNIAITCHGLLHHHNHICSSCNCCYSSCYLQYHHDHLVQLTGKYCDFLFTNCKIIVITFAKHKMIAITLVIYRIFQNALKACVIIICIHGSWEHCKDSCNLRNHCGCFVDCNTIVIAFLACGTNAIPYATCGILLITFCELWYQHNGVCNVWNHCGSSCGLIESLQVSQLAELLQSQLQIAI